jgi:glycine/D-amino acid oxidase-like deaminating enzyme
VNWDGPSPALLMSMNNNPRQIGDGAFEYRWYGRGAMTADLLPDLHEAAPGVTAALGYNGRGIAAGTALGTVLARRALGEPAATLPFPVTALSALPLNVAAAVPYYASVVRRRLRGLFAG